jgi:hypothetical protein
MARALRALYGGWLMARALRALYGLWRIARALRALYGEQLAAQPSAISYTLYAIRYMPSAIS